jgi:hypothetical protein
VDVNIRTKMTLDGKEFDLRRLPRMIEDKLGYKPKGIMFQWRERIKAVFKKEFWPWKIGKMLSLWVRRKDSYASGAGGGESYWAPHTPATIQWKKRNKLKQGFWIATGKTIKGLERQAQRKGEPWNELKPSTSYAQYVNDGHPTGGFFNRGGRASYCPPRPLFYFTREDVRKAQSLANSVLRQLIKEFKQ